MPAPLSAGDVVPASAETDFTPALTAGTTDPTLGTGSVQSGRYYVDPITGWVRGQLVITFGTSGTNAGSGNYRIEMPTAIDNLVSGSSFGTADIIGYGVIRDASVTTNSRTVIASRFNNSGGASGGGVVQLSVLDGTTGNVTHAAPFAWAASDSISLQFAYPGA